MSSPASILGSRKEQGIRTVASLCGFILLCSAGDRTQDMLDKHTPPLIYTPSHKIYFKNNPMPYQATKAPRKSWTRALLRLLTLATTESCHLPSHISTGLFMLPLCLCNWSLHRKIKGMVQGASGQLNTQKTHLHAEWVLHPSYTGTEIPCLRSLQISLDMYLFIWMCTYNIYDIRFLNSA